MKYSRTGQHTRVGRLARNCWRTCWPNAVVSDDALTRCFYELRRQLSHAGATSATGHSSNLCRSAATGLNGKNFLHSRKRRRRRSPLPRRPGGRDRCAVDGREPVDPASSAAAGSIAVLPFLDMSAEKDQSFFSDGITEEILNRLSQSENLRVIARTSSFSFKDETLDVPQIGERLNVAYVLEGSVRKSADRVRITAQLIDVSTNAHVWSETYDRGVDDLFAIQDEIASSVATALQVTLARGRPRGRMPENIDAYERFLHGQFFYNRRAPGDIDRSVRYYKEAVATILNTRGRCRPRRSVRTTAGHGDNPEKLRESRARRRGKRSSGSEACVAHARCSVLLQPLQREKGDEHTRKAIALDPDDPLVWALPVAGRSDGISNRRSPCGADRRKDPLSR